MYICFFFFVLVVFVLFFVSFKITVSFRPPFPLSINIIRSEVQVTEKTCIYSIYNQIWILSIFDTFKIYFCALNYRIYNQIWILSIFDTFKIYFCNLFCNALLCFTVVVKGSKLVLKGVTTVILLSQNVQLSIFFAGLTIRLT